MAGAQLVGGGGSRALIVGGDSLVGAAIELQCRSLGDAAEVSSRRRERAGLFLDLRDPDFVLLERTRYDVAFLCAAVTSMQACQSEPAATARINVDNTIELMCRLADRGTHLVFLSSSQVFDGETSAPGEEEATNPRNQYGLQKLAVEQAIARHRLPAAVLRVTKVLGTRPAGIFGDWLRALGRGETICAATNMSLSPVPVDEVASVARSLAVGRHRGIWHFGARDELTYFDAARLVASSRPVPLERVRGAAVSETQVASIYRQRHATLSTAKLARELGVPVPSAREVLARLFQGSSVP